MVPNRATHHIYGGFIQKIYFSELLLKAKPDVLLFSRNTEINSYMALLWQSLLVLQYTKFNKKTKKEESFANFLTYRKLEFVKHKLGQQLQ